MNKRKRMSWENLNPKIINYVVAKGLQHVGTQVGQKVIDAVTGSFTSTQTQTKDSSVMKRGQVQKAYLAGKVKPKTRTSKKLTYRVKKGKYKGKKRSTRLGLQSSGVRYIQEIRWQSKQDTTDKYESIQVGHTSMPTRPVLLVLCRAMIKKLFAKHFRIKDFTDNCTAQPYNLIANDSIYMYFYDDWKTNTGASSGFAIAANDTFENLAVSLYNVLASLILPQTIQNLRFEEMRYVPTTGTQPPIVMPLIGAMFECNIKSALKLQNRTVNSSGNNEADDVDNVPLTGYLYDLKGNNMWNRTNRQGLAAIGTGNEASNDIVLYGYYQASTGAANTLTRGEPVQTASANSAFNRPSEPPKPYEVLNCKKSAKVRVNPGGIKTSVLSQKFKLNFTYLLKLLLEDRNARPEVTQTYNERKGYCRVFHLEKIIGNNTTSVAIGAEVQLDIWARLITKPESKYTGPVQIQTDHGVFPAV